MAIPYATKNEISRLKKQSLKCKRDLQSINAPVIVDGKTKVENIYFDITKTPREVDKILNDFFIKNIEQIASDEYYIFNSLNDDFTGIVFYIFGEFSGDINNIILTNAFIACYADSIETMKKIFPGTNIEEVEILIYDSNNGWNPELSKVNGKAIVSSISNTEIESMNIVPVGNFNDKLSDLVYSEKLGLVEAETGVLLDSNNNKFYPKTIISRVKDGNNAWKHEVDTKDIIPFIELDMSYIENQTPLPDELYNLLISETENYYINIIQNDIPVSLFIDMSSQDGLAGLVAHSYVSGNYWKLFIDDMKVPSLVKIDTITAEAPTEVGEYDIRVTKTGESISAPRFNKVN